MQAVFPRGSTKGCKVQGEATGGEDDDAQYVYEDKVSVSDGRLTVSGDFPTCHSLERITIRGKHT